MRVFILLAFACVVSADGPGGDHGHQHDHQLVQLARVGRQDAGVQGGVDFSGCVTDPDTGLCCVEKEETVTSLEKEPILECTHKNTEQCHYTYVTQFKPLWKRFVKRTLRSSAPSLSSSRHSMRL
eukprot:TRINITY_DN13081_c0_g1_i1.p1 TRINITY_DN13081_c0_g1~~TRINITY_DN13081_c0_g1_i1.p1  ORF type:complete len:144 (-),score=55.95 TRINITY_DN13081_c0_g1_i1:40-414(-)